MTAGVGGGGKEEKASLWPLVSTLKKGLTLSCARLLPKEYKKFSAPVAGRLTTLQVQFPRHSKKKDNVVS